MQDLKAIHEELQDSLKQEIGATREVLSNMLQEEACLLNGDKTGWNQVMIERSFLLARLYYLRSKRSEITKLLPKLQEETSFELLSMRDQLAALLAKLNLQNQRLLSLEMHAPKKSHPSSQETPIAKKNKTSIATYPEKPSS